MCPFRTRLPRAPYDTRARFARGKRGQALIELLAVVVVFSFIAIATIETAILYHNMNAVSNGLKQAVWAAAYGAPNEKIYAILEESGKNILVGAFLEQKADTFYIEVWQPANDTGVAEVYLAPYGATTCDSMLSGGKADRAAYLYRAEGMNVRVGLGYEVGYFVPFFGATPIFSVRIPLAVSQTLAHRNDEDRDGLVDLYEPELIQGALGPNFFVPLKHVDLGGDTIYSDTPAGPDSNFDADTYLDIDDPPGFETAGVATIFLYNYDYDNDGIEDRFERALPADTPNMLIHPLLGAPGRRANLAGLAACS